jgi:DNA-binding transcriptional LysR family regulator
MYQLLNNFEDLMLLKQVIESGSINKAAAVAHLAQPAMTRRMRRLEQQLGVQLLDRTARGVLPTIYATSLVAHLQTIDLELQRAWNNVESLRTGPSFGHVALGCASALLNHLVPAALERFQQARPRVRVSVVEAPSPALLGMLRREELDIAILGALCPVPEHDLLEESLGKDPTVICVRASHPLSGRKSVTLADLAKTQSWVFPEASSDFYEAVKGEFERLGVPLPTTVLQTHSTPAVLRLLGTTTRVAITSATVVAEQLFERKLVKLTGDWNFASLHVILYRRKSSGRSPALSSLIGVLRASAAHVFAP